MVNHWKKGDDQGRWSDARNFLKAGNISQNQKTT